MALEFEAKNYRAVEKTVHHIKFVEGKKVLDEVKPNPKGEHGAEISFIPNKKYLGKNAHIDIDKIYEWMVSLSYLLSAEKKSITTKFEVWEKSKLIRKEKIKSKPFSELLDKICKKPAVQPVSIVKKTKVEETDFGGKKSKKDLLIEIAFSYDSINDPDQACIVDSYCNYTNTINGGVHNDTVDECLCRFFTTETKKSMTDKEKEKIDILWQDVRTDLRVVINLATAAQVLFLGNQKQNASNQELGPVIKDLINEGLQEVFGKNQTLLNSYIKQVKLNAKARIELTKIKSVNTRVKTNSFADHLDENFTPCNNRGKQYKELYLVEGQRSAAGSVVDARNYDIQAVLGFRGVTANAFKRDITNIFDNAEWKNYCSKIHYDIKAKNVDQVYYDKIIISTDADTDGFGISSGICAFHAKFARPLIEKGLLYKVYPPLYHIDDKKHPFARDKRELIDVYVDKILNNYTVKMKNRDNDFKKSELKEFIYTTEYYLDELEMVASHYKLNRTLVEIMGYNLVMYYLTKCKNDDDYGVVLNKAMSDSRFIKKMMSEIQDRFPEITLEDNYTIQGVISGDFQAITLTPKFIQKTMIFKDIFVNYGIYLRYKELNIPKNGTIGEFLADTLKYRYKIIERYKGLGEANWQDLASTIMDPARRILVQLTFDDVDRDLKIIEMLHSSSVEARRARKKLMKDYIINRDDIDN